MDENLVQFAMDNGIEVLTWNYSPPFRAIYLHLTGSKPVIGYIPGLEKDIALFRSVFAEELGHHFTSAGHALADRHINYGEQLKISQVEHRALYWGALFLMPLEELIQAVESGLEEIWELAEHFRVTEEFISFRAGLKDFQLYLSTAGRRF